MLAISLMAYCSPPIWVSVFWACASIDFIICHLGLSGMKNANMRNKPAGIASAQNIHRQPIWPFHDARMSAVVKASGTGSAICQLAICAHIVKKQA